MDNQGYYMGQMQQFRQKFWTPSKILGLLSTVLLLLGLLLPAMDFSHFHEKVNIQYNLMKICKNVGLISSMWRGIPYGIIIGIIAMAIFSFVRIPLFKLIPCFLIVAMFVLMLADVHNVVDWVDNVLNKYFENYNIVVSVSDVVKSFMIGVYLLVTGLVVGFISCFMKE